MILNIFKNDFFLDCRTPCILCYKNVHIVALVTRFNERQLFLYNFVFFIPFLCRHGAPKSSLSDQGRKFVNSTIQTLFHLTGIKHKVTFAYHPQCNGLVERYNQTLQRSLLNLVSDKHNDWDMFLDGVLFAYRTSEHK